MGCRYGRASGFAFCVRIGSGLPARKTEIVVTATKIASVFGWDMGGSFPGSGVIHCHAASQPRSNRRRGEQEFTNVSLFLSFSCGIFGAEVARTRFQSLDLP